MIEENTRRNISVVLNEEEREKKRLKIEQIDNMREESYMHHVNAIFKGCMAGLFGITSILYGTGVIKADTNTAQKLYTAVCAVTSGAWGVGVASSLQAKKEKDAEIEEITRDVLRI